MTFLQRIFEATSGPVGEKVWRRLAKMYRWNNFVRGERVMENFNFSGSSIFVKIYEFDSDFLKDYFLLNSKSRLFS